MEYNNFKFNARLIAEKMWGTGGTRAYKTNRKGAYYYSCAGHGGYIVKSEALSETEKENVKKYWGGGYVLYLLTDQDTREVYGVDYAHVPASNVKRSNKGFKVKLGAHVKWEKYIFYVFEEDCDWSILEKFTDVRLKDNPSTEEQIESSFNSILEYNKQQDEREELLNNGEYMLAYGKGLDNGNVEAGFRNKNGDEKVVEILDSVYSERIVNQTLSNFESRGGVLK